MCYLIPYPKVGQSLHVPHKRSFPGEIESGWFISVPFHPLLPPPKENTGSWQPVSVNLSCYCQHPYTEAWMELLEKAQSPERGPVLRRHVGGSWCALWADVDQAPCQSQDSLSYRYSENFL